MRGQEIFFGKGQCASCHQPPFYTDNLMHDLKTERFFKPEMVNYAMEVGAAMSKSAKSEGGRKAVYFTEIDQVRGQPPMT